MPTSNTGVTLPDFVVAGASRSGTTTLAGMLLQHPQVHLPPRELHYFCRAPINGYAVNASDYARLFVGAKPGQTVGEKTPGYMYLPWVPESMARVVPEARLVFLLRDPVQRAYSHYWKSVRSGREPLTFEQALRAEPARVQGSELDRAHYSYVDRGFYMRQIEAFLSHYRRDRMLFLLSEDLYARPADALAEVCAFVGVSVLPRVTVPPANKSPTPTMLWLYRRLSGIDLRYRGDGRRWRIRRAARRARRLIPMKVRTYPLMKDDTRRWLADVYHEESSALQTFLGIDLSRWTVFRHKGAGEQP